MSAAPYGRGLTRGSLAAKPWAMIGGGMVADPHPAISSAAMTAPAAARSSFFMRNLTKRDPLRWHRTDYTVVELLLPAMAPGSAIIG